MAFRGGAGSSSCGLPSLICEGTAPPLQAAAGLRETLGEEVAGEGELAGATVDCGMGAGYAVSVPSCVCFGPDSACD